ncbi:MAG: phosphodiester glycosidase family protein [bacterium]|nr:phosphodiester glycosidase family protein [bacterium]
MNLFNVKGSLLKVISLLLLSLVLISGTVLADEATLPRLLGCRGRLNGDIYRLVLDLSAPVKDYKVEASGRNLKIYLSGFDTTVAADLPLPEAGFVRSVKAGPAAGGLEVNVDLAYRAPVKAYRLPPAAAYPDRLVLDIRRIYEERQERTVAGLKVVDIYRGTAAGPVAVHAVLIPPGKAYRLQPVRAQKLETVSSIARRNGALAAVNGGYFDRSGRPLGALIIEGRWEGYPLLNRSALYIDKTGAISFGTEPALPSIEPLSDSTPWYCLGAGPRLVEQGQMKITAREEAFRDDIAVGRAPRTGLGLAADGTVVLAVVDGRQPGISIGMTLEELATLLLNLGARDALNFDGGGSSALYLDGTILNSPSDGRERPVASALAVFAGQSEGVSVAQGNNG